MDSSHRQSHDERSRLDEPSAHARLSRSPHPYHRASQELPEPIFLSNPRTGVQQARHPPLGDPPVNQPSDYFGAKSSRLGLRPDAISSGSHRRRSYQATPSESGTEADDEKPLLKALTAPPLRPRKGLRDATGSGLELNTPLPTPSLGDDSHGSEERLRRRTAQQIYKAAFKRPSRQQDAKRRAIYARRVVEILLQAGVGCLFLARLLPPVRTKSMLHCGVILGIYSMYLLRVARLRMGNGLSNILRLSPRSALEVAPFLYPFTVPILIAFSLAGAGPLVEANFVLGLCSIPLQFIPFHDVHVHWLASLLPLAYERLSFFRLGAHVPSGGAADAEQMTLLLPLHYSLMTCVEFLATTSLLPTESQLLSIGLINLMLFTTSPPAYILKALLWIGSISIFCTCRHLLRWTVSLARVPRWRFRRVQRKSFRHNRVLAAIDDTLGGWLSSALSRSHVDDSDSDSDNVPFQDRLKKFRSNLNVKDSGAFSVKRPASSGRSRRSIDDIGHRTVEGSRSPKRGHSRRYTLPTAPSALPDLPQLRRSATKGFARFRDQPKYYLSLTSAQATLLKWLYAGIVYTVILLTILGPLRVYIGRRALSGEEPFGWAAGYLLGDLPSFRLQVVLWRLDRWICLPPFDDSPHEALGLAESLRIYTIGAANVRLLICAYCVGIIAIGIAIVMHLSTIAEVDTRRKIFHGMMVAMFGVTGFIDPSLVSLSFVLVLAGFLLLDLFRAAQLPPLSKPLTIFLAPYVDGRDFKGPVVVSHLFLLTGCAVPFWLSLAALERTGSGAFEGWEVAERELSMLTGIVCVGMGDAAASLIGRRWGRRRWAWGGGKSIEGSLAFAVAVTVGLVLARVYLAVGGWPAAWHDGWVVAGGKIIVAACATSVTEAVLTGANDNVLVPVVLWLWVRALAL